jgi:STE24 endopeptidase
MKILLGCYLLVLTVTYWLRFLNLRHLRKHGDELPTGFELVIDAETLRRTTAYTLDQNRLALVESACSNSLLLVFIFGGWLGVYDCWVAAHTGSFIGGGIAFFLLIAFAEGVIEIPFSLYRTFRIENRYGFNTMTFRLWLADLAKSTAIAALLLSLVTAGGLALVRVSPTHWWLWVWLFFAGVSIFLMYISPYVIEPLFFKFEPVTTAGLEDEIRVLVEKAGLRVSRVMQVDASRRSTHSNAYFTGIGRVKRIILFDTLLQQMNHGEILAILAHEIGHWRKGHIMKRLAVTQLAALLSCYLAFRLSPWGGLPALLGLDRASFPAQLVILAFLGSLAAFPLTPLSSWLSRRHEWEADRFACTLTGTPADLATALVKLSRENLANLHPHPLYAAVYYSHPPLVERVRKLLEKQAGSTEARKNGR